ncbi:hypothetical protein DFJ74DRAFT_763182 [Hyaloraphidium curvatum]|nr:hypothetical protein DFJ74DRAFT_763182 [Hyaloraphidium curvatum]
MACSGRAKDPAPPTSRVSLVPDGPLAGAAADGYPFILDSLLGKGYRRLDFTTAAKEPSDREAVLLWLNRGWGWGFGFNHDEAAECFKKAIELDKDGCPMAWWGLAWTTSPNYNLVRQSSPPAGFWNLIAMPSGTQPIREDAEDQTSRDAAVKALEIAERCGAEWEKRLCAAMVRRHVVEGRPELVRKDAEARAILDQNYADAMQAAYDALYPGSHDPDVAALAAEALMQLSPWKLWPYVPTPPEDFVTVSKAPEIPELTARILGIVARAFEDEPKNKEHTGLVHLWIHVWEMSPTPGRGLELGQYLLHATELGSGHLLHMPSHLQVQIGAYKEAVEANKRAWEADQRFLKHHQGGVYTMYIIHDLHMLVFAALFQANKADAMAYSDTLTALCSDGVIRAFPDLLESYVPLKLHAMIRFGMFEEMLEQPMPEDREMYCTTAATVLYARGIAFAALGDVKAAREEQAQFREAKGRIPESRMHFQVPVSLIMEVADEMLEGEILFREGRHDECFERIRKAVRLDDALPYMEPWGWMVPARHALGALLLAAGRAGEATPIYRADMSTCKHPDNIWSLRGLLECLEILGKGAELHPGETEEIRARVAGKAAEADVAVNVSCYCRR